MKRKPAGNGITPNTMNLQRRERLLRKVKLDKGGGATIEWLDVNFDPESGSYVKNSDGRTSDGHVHEDLKAAMDKLIEHLMIAAEEVGETKGNYGFDGSLKGIEKYRVSSVTLRGGVPNDGDGEDPKPIQVFIYGRRKLKSGHVKNFGTYGIKLAHAQESYKHTAQLEGHIAAVEAEAWLYLEGKILPPEQQALQLGEGDGIEEGMELGEEK